MGEGGYTHCGGRGALCKEPKCLLRGENPGAGSLWELLTACPVPGAEGGGRGRGVVTALSDFHKQSRCCGLPEPCPRPAGLQGPGECVRGTNSTFTPTRPWVSAGSLPTGI